MRYIQEAMLDKYNKTGLWTEHDAAYILLTPRAEQLNWVDNGQTDRNGNVIEQTGLKTQLETLNLPMQVTTIKDLPNGNNETEIMDIFQRMFGVLQPGDELYFDITHAFRYMPMLFISLGNYARSILGATVKAISYGNFVASQEDGGIAPIIDLMPIFDIQASLYSQLKH